MSTPPFDPNDPLRQIIRVDQMRGLDAELTIVDAEELAASLAEAGLHEAQVEALRRSDLSLQTYVRLVELEMACLRDQGIEPSPLEVSTLAYGVRQPTYGCPAEVAGMTDGEISRIQVTCQNRFTGAYQALYAAKFTPSPDEALARDLAAANEFLDCARSRWIDPPIAAVRNSSDFDAFYAWYATPEADIDCHFRP